MPRYKVEIGVSCDCTKSVEAMNVERAEEIAWEGTNLEGDECECQVTDMSTHEE